MDVSASASLKQQTPVRNRFCRLCGASTRLRVLTSATIREWRPTGCAPHTYTQKVSMTNQ
ncbi:hypothetical protein CBM2609_A140351 [Cupriavidus taiwanensis]|nr:hypothetical protein CBM2604_A120349 [Cupriavidus taiwanensis]SOZ25626.1 hypothetical protein CBM2609_A140351 [Cupriavidus taiwanensis]